MISSPTTPDSHKPRDLHPLEQGIGYDLSGPDPNQAVNGVGIVYANMRLCFDVSKLHLRVLVNTVLGPIPPPTPPAGGAVAPAVPATAPAAGPNVALVQLSSTAADADLDALISWLSSLKGLQTMAASKKNDKNAKPST